MNSFYWSDLSQPQIHTGNKQKSNQTVEHFAQKKFSSTEEKKDNDTKYSNKEQIMAFSFCFTAVPDRQQVQINT